MWIFYMKSTKFYKCQQHSIQNKVYICVFHSILCVFALWFIVVHFKCIHMYVYMCIPTVPGSLKSVKRFKSYVISKEKMYKNDPFYGWNVDIAISEWTLYQDFFTFFTKNTYLDLYTVLASALELRHVSSPQFLDEWLANRTPSWTKRSRSDLDRDFWEANPSTRNSGEKIEPLH